MNRTAIMSFCNNLSAFCGIDIRICENNHHSFSALCYDNENRLFDYCKDEVFKSGVCSPSFKFCPHGLTFAVLPYDDNSFAVLGPVVTTPFELSEIESLAYLSLFNDLPKETALAFLSDIPHIPIVEFAKLSNAIYAALSNNTANIEVKVSKQEFSQKNFYEESSHTQDNAYRFEKEILSIVKQGLVEEVEKVITLKNFTGSIGTLSTDSLRQFKNMLEVLLTLCSRAAIEGGLPPSISYEYSDKFFLKIENSASLNDFSIGYEIITVFAKAVRNYNFTPPKHYIVHKTERFVNSHIYEPLSLKRISEEFCMNKNYLSSLFTKQTGKTLTSFIRERKIAHAKFLLETTNLRLVNISEALSFSSQSAFSNAFRTFVGVSPKAYRDSLSENETYC